MTWCTKCDTYMLFPNSHKCPPMFICEPQDNFYGDGCEREICEINPQYAAQKFCEAWDSEGDYDIIRSGEFRVKVTDPRNNEVTYWDIVAEAVPQYTAYKQKGNVNE